MTKQKYIVIAKVPGKFVKYRTNHTDKFIKFLVKKFPGACWANFYKRDTRAIFATWGNKKGLIYEQ